MKQHLQKINRLVTKKPYINFSAPSTQGDKTASNTITIWVHGTRFLPAHYLPQFFYATPGLHRPEVLPDNYRIRRRLELLSTTSQHRFGNEHLYFFGWNGKLSFAEREQAATNFLLDLQELINSYIIIHCIQPKIKVITHSHGGNVILNCAKIEATLQTNIIIDELILLACPVQKATANYITHNMFKKIYTFFSSTDSVQVLDPQGLYNKNNPLLFPIFSERKFATRPNVYNVQVRYKNRGIMHIDFVRKDFIRQLADILDFIDTYKDKQPNFFNTEYLKLKINH